MENEKLLQKKRSELYKSSFIMLAMVRTGDNSGGWETLAYSLAQLSKEELYDFLQENLTEKEKKNLARSSSATQLLECLIPIMMKVDYYDCLLNHNIPSTVFDEFLFQYCTYSVASVLPRGTELLERIIKHPNVPNELLQTIDELVEVFEGNKSSHFKKALMEIQKGSHQTPPKDTYDYSGDVFRFADEFQSYERIRKIIKQKVSPEN